MEMEESEEIDVKSLNLHPRIEPYIENLLTELKNDGIEDFVKIHFANIKDRRNDWFTVAMHDFRGNQIKVLFRFILFDKGLDLSKSLRIFLENVHSCCPASINLFYSGMRCDFDSLEIFGLPKQSCWELFKHSNTFSFYNVIRCAFDQWRQFRVKQINRKYENPVYLKSIEYHLKNHEFVSRYDYVFSESNTSFQGTFFSSMYIIVRKNYLTYNFPLLLVICAMKNDNETKEIAKHCHTGKPISIIIEFDKTFPEDDTEDKYLVKNVKIHRSKSVESLLWRSNNEPIAIPEYQNSNIIEYITDIW